MGQNWRLVHRTSSPQQRARRIVEQFSTAEDSIDRYRRLVALGEAMPDLSAAHRTDENRLPGCQYDLWIRATYDPAADALHFRAYSDAKITRGLAALIIGVLDGLSPRAILSADLEFLDTIGVRTHLSVHRSNGLAAMVEEIRSRARAHLGPEPRPEPRPGPGRGPGRDTRGEHGEERRTA